MIKATPVAPKPSPFPSDLNSLVPYRETPWNVSSSLFNRIKSQNPNNHFRLCEILNSDAEFNFILKYFEHHKPSGYSIKRIICIHNPDHTQVFEGTLKNMEREANNPVFAPKGKEEDPKLERAHALTRWEQQAAQFSPVEIKSSASRTDSCIKAKVLPLWHGSSEEVCQSVFSSGFTSFGKHHYFEASAKKGNTKSTDKGYFGSGIYFTNSAHYASMYSQGHLLMAWVSMREPYPVVSDMPHPNKCTDMTKLGGKEHYQNYNAHFISVASIEPNNPKCMNYYPCYKDQPPAWDEFVVFHTSQALPRFWIELAVDLPTVVPSTPLNAGEFLNLILKLIDKEEIKQEKALLKLLYVKMEYLLELSETTPLEFGDEKFFMLIEKPLAKGQKISKGLMNMLLKSELLTVTSSPSKIPFVSSTSIQPVMSPNIQKPSALAVTSISAVLTSTPVKPVLPAIAFGKEKWATFIGDVGIEPPLPADIDKILAAPCPFFPGKKVEQTHLLTLIPQTVDGKPLTLNSLEDLVKHPKKGLRTKYRFYWDHIKKKYGTVTLASSYWVLFTKDIIPESQSKNFDEQKQLLVKYSQQAQGTYEIPQLLEANVSIFMEYLQTGKRLYSSEAKTYTSCQECLSKTVIIPSSPNGFFSNNSKGLWVVVGGFAQNGLSIFQKDLVDYGVGGVRRL